MNGASFESKLGCSFLAIECKNIPVKAFWGLGAFMKLTTTDFLLETLKIWRGAAVWKRGRPHKLKIIVGALKSVAVMGGVGRKSALERDFSTQQGGGGVEIINKKSKI